MRFPTLFYSMVLATIGLSSNTLTQDPITDSADFYYPGSSSELAVKALLTSCQKIPSFENVVESELFDDTLQIITVDGLKYAIGPKMGNEGGLDRLLIRQIWGVNDGVSNESGSIFCNIVNKANNVVSLTHYGGFFQSDGNVTFNNLLRAEDLVEMLGYHTTALRVGLEGGYPEDGWQEFME